VNPKRILLGLFFLGLLSCFLAPAEAVAQEQRGRVSGLTPEQYSRERLRILHEIYAERAAQEQARKAREAARRARIEERGCNRPASCAFVEGVKGLAWFFTPYE
jgi:hypothetical protein